VRHFPLVGALIGAAGAALTLTPVQAAYLRDGLLNLTIHDNFTQQTDRGQLLQNPLDHPRFFVRQQYYDFLSREPDLAGGDYWLNQIRACGVDVSCIRQRISAAFFIEQEFQESGAYVFRLYKAAFGEQAAYRPTFAQFLPDRARVVGSAMLEQGKLDFARVFAQRPTFVSRYPASQTAAQFVDAILANVQQGSGVTFNAAERQNFLNDVNNGGRGLMLKNLADNVAFQQAVYNRAFVLLQYFGYLRRDPDQAGYDFWLNTLNQQPNNFRGMVCAFLTATEYQQRFSPVATRSNQACQTP
jgi:hypothetical protein